MTPTTETTPLTKWTVPTTTPHGPRQPLLPAEPRRESVRDGVGTNARRPDGIPKVKGEFAYSSDLWAEGMLHGATVRSPHPYARIVRIDTSPAKAIEGVRSVLTHEDVPGAKTYGMEHADQPVLAWDIVRYHGEAVAIVAAEDPETARRAADAVVVEYEVLEPVVDVEYAIGGDAPELHEGTGNVTRHVHIHTGDQAPTAPVVVRGRYEMGMQDQAFLGPESGLVIPAEDGGVDIYVATQWMHTDRDQVAPCLGLSAEQVRITLAGVGGAFGGREDLSMQAHASMLALATQRPVRMVYSREESFFGHIHRHPAWMEYEHGATEDGTLVYVKVRVLLDGGAYTSSSTAVASNAARFALGPYVVPNATIDATVAYTNNPPCGAMRGFGAVQVALGHEGQMDRLAAKLGMDPVELRIINAMRQGDRLPTGQVVENPAPVRELLEAVRDAPRRELAPVATREVGAGGGLDIRQLPGGAANTTHGEDVRRGVGYGVGFKNVGFAEGFDDYSTARVTLSRGADGPIVSVHHAAAEVGQGLVTICMQIGRTELPVGPCVVLPADTQVGSAGSSSASRQTYMTGGAVKQSAELVRAELLDRAAAHTSVAREGMRLDDDGTIRDAAGEVIVADVSELLSTPIEVEREFRHKRTFPLDPETGQGDADVQFAFAAHRAVVDVDAGLGIVRVLDMATAQDVGKAMNPQQLEGQIEGGTSHGVGLALMEEIQVVNGTVRNPSFTDYLIPTTLDMPTVQMTILELGDPEAPYGVRGVGEPPSISSTPAIAAAVRDATGIDLIRVPIRPDDIVFGSPPAVD
ncbi:MAG: xanthine dehydrogenase, molybdenum binding subunit apoprotein [Thermoleophilia bacterium]|nr:xanthine dehydrogenase, molybdenum binding subunit apoprotein [Thermoleophilia bacterium]